MKIRYIGYLVRLCPVTKQTQLSLPGTCRGDETSLVASKSSRQLQHHRVCAGETKDITAEIYIWLRRFAFLRRGVHPAYANNLITPPLPRLHSTI